VDRLTYVLGGLLCGLLASGCGQDEIARSDQPVPEGAGGADETAGAGSGPTQLSPEGALNDQPRDCPLAPTLGAARTARLELRAVVEYGGVPLEIGDVKTDVEGGTYQVTFFAYYLGNFQLLDDEGAPHAASLVDAQDVPLPYGLQLLNMDKPESEQLRLAAEPGKYAALRFSVGVHQACNMIPLADRIWPMSIETEMNWGWTMLNLRLECNHDTPTKRYGLMYHVGLENEYRTVQLSTPLELGAEPSRHTLRLAVDRLLGADTPLEITLEDQFLTNLVSKTFTLQ
jgi:hypothetical protein